jgi:beta-glucanase (GH16 family)
VEIKYSFRISAYNVKKVLVWSDEFNIDGKYSTKNWKPNIGNGVNGWGNSEEQYYTDSNALISNGTLIIEARKEHMHSYNYTSARLVSAEQFRYGIFEARIKMNKGTGTWYAFWLLSSKVPLKWPNDGNCFSSLIIEKCNSADQRSLSCLNKWLH